MVIGLVAIVVLPAVAGLLAIKASGADDSRQRLGAFVLGVALLVCAVWFLGRADESPFEAVGALLGAAGCTAAIWSARSRSLGVERPPMAPKRVGCLAAVAGLAVAGLAGWAWLDATFGQDDPVHVRTSSADLEPWPTGIDVLETRAVMGGPSVSIETAPDIERLYVVLVSDGLAAEETASAVTDHLSALGWALEAARPGAWFVFSGGGPAGERAYVGALSAYLDSGLGVAEDGEAGPQLRESVGDRLDSAVVVQVFAVG